MPQLLHIARWCLTLVTSTYFEMGICLLIVLNTAAVATTYHGMSDWHVALLERADVAFLAVFTAEIILRLVAFGPRAYFQGRWNLLDFGIVVGGYVSFIITMTTPVQPQITYLRFSRGGRRKRLVLRLGGGFSMTFTATRNVCVCVCVCVCVRACVRAAMCRTSTCVCPSRRWALERRPFALGSGPWPMPPRPTPTPFHVHAPGTALPLRGQPVARGTGGAEMRVRDGGCGDESEGRGVRR